ncbi:hypothetical protein BJ878DRAFT_541942 [Calycina marina]|uniref:Ubiquitin interaction domain-containing protein n=1 Tax=Calycina marina TaxID=1763456 RepID=A0A9P8CGU1_9HELO|nr:hypothetical protein BJ878DRAFT_541942 [Calycina marina]
MASTEPSSGDVDTFYEFTGITDSTIDRAEVRKRLKEHKNNLPDAVGEYFDNPTSTKYKTPVLDWDPTLHERDREGVYDPKNRSSAPEFRIQGPDELPSYSMTNDGGRSAAPSRIPSPHPSIRQANTDEDEDLKRAIRESLGEQQGPIDLTGDEGEQMSGIRFGPAQRPPWETDTWQMVHTPSKPSEPEPAYRKRDLEAPAFLKPGNGHRLAALLTIYHGIPLLREVFICRKDILPDYGYGEDWWSGKPISAPLKDDTEPYTHEEEFGHELQRLMAFLENTDRSYGSVRALENSQAVQRELSKQRMKSTETAALEVYNRLMRESPEMYGKLFSQMSSGTEERSNFSIFQAPFPDEDSTDETIYDLADRALWPESVSEIDDVPFINHIADVVTFQLTNWTINKKSGIKFPAVWYPDRYLEPARQAAQDMRLKKPIIYQKLQKICDVESTLNGLRFHAGKTLTLQEMFQTSMLHDSDEIDVPLSEEQLIDVNEAPKTGDLSAQLTRLFKSIERKVKSLNEEKELCRAELRELSKLYTEPSDDPDQPTLHKYTLRGVCPDMDTMYIRRASEPSLVTLDISGDEAESDKEQWWRIHYASADSNPVTVEKSTEERVLEATSYHSEKEGPLVVYANEKAMTHKRFPLPSALEKFVQLDNAAFKAEFSADVDSSPSPTPKSPGKRTYSERDSDDDISPLMRTISSHNSNKHPVVVSEREVDEQETFEPFNSAYVTNGIDPAAVGGQEMQERSSTRGLMSPPQQGGQSGTIDSMDLDQMLEDDNVANESKAVRRVGFADK